MFLQRTSAALSEHPIFMGPYTLCNTYTSTLNYAENGGEAGTTAALQVQQLTDGALYSVQHWMVSHTLGSAMQPSVLSWARRSWLLPRLLDE